MPVSPTQPLAFERPPEPLRRCVSQQRAIEHLDPLDPPSGCVAAEVAAESLHVRQLGHDRARAPEQAASYAASRSASSSRRTGRRSRAWDLISGTPASPDLKRRAISLPTSGSSPSTCTEGKSSHSRSGTSPTYSAHFSAQTCFRGRKSAKDAGRDTALQTHSEFEEGDDLIGCHFVRLAPPQEVFPRFGRGTCGNRSLEGNRS